MPQPPPQRLCKASDLENALGGMNVMRQLLDKDKDRNPDPPLVDTCLGFGTTHMAGLIWPKVDISSLQEPYPERLVLLAAQVAAYKAWLIGSEGQAVPEHVQRGFDQATDVGRAIGEGRDTIGSVPKPALDPPAEGIVDYDPLGQGISVTAFRKAGFR